LLRIALLSAFWALVVFELSDNKKGPEEAPCTPPEVGMALAIPGGVPGYDEDKEFGNNITHVSAQLPKGCATIAARRPMSRECHRLPRFCQLSGVPAIRRGRICNFGDTERATAQVSSRTSREPEVTGWVESCRCTLPPCGFLRGPIRHVQTSRRQCRGRPCL
jgi:hypothetical protein